MGSLGTRYVWPREVKSYGFEVVRVICWVTFGCFWVLCPSFSFFPIEGSLGPDEFQESFLQRLQCQGQLKRWQKIGKNYGEVGENMWKLQGFAVVFHGFWHQRNHGLEGLLKVFLCFGSWIGGFKPKRKAFCWSQRGSHSWRFKSSILSEHKAMASKREPLFGDHRFCFFSLLPIDCLGYMFLTRSQLFHTCC